MFSAECRFVYTPMLQHTIEDLNCQNIDTPVSLITTNSNITYT